MKYLNKISLLVSFLTVALFSACSTDQEGPIYSEEGQGVTFISSALTSVVVSPNEPTFTVDIFRSNNSTEYSGNVLLTAMLGDEELSGCTVSGFSFAAGESQTKVTVDISPLEIGDELDITLTLDVPETDIAKSDFPTASLVASKDYNWIELGTGTFNDNYFFGEVNEVKVYQAEGFDRWRVETPYTAYFANGLPEWLAGQFNAALTLLPANVDFWLQDGVVYYNSFGIGLNYPGYGDIYAYHPANFQGTTNAHNKRVDEKTFYLAPYYYIPDFGGGFDATAEEGAIVITLP